MFSFMLICCACLLLIVFALVFTRTCLLVTTVINQSMTPALEAGDRVLVLRKYLLPCLRKGQIVLVTLPHEAEKNAEHSKPTLYIKRIVALSGETFEDEHPGVSRWITDTDSEQMCHSWHIPPDCLFVCGDNRHASIDSRTWGPLPIKSVQGIVLWKLSRKAPVPRISPPVQSLTPGQRAPFFSAPALSGETRTLHQYRGQNVLLLFTATHKWCRARLPWCLSQLAGAMRSGLTIVCVSTDELTKTRAFSEELRLAVPVLVAPREQNPFLNDYRVLGTPAYCLLGEEGNVLATGFPSEHDRAWQELSGNGQAAQR
jgi:signal peptidase I